MATGKVEKPFLVKLFQRAPEIVDEVPFATRDEQEESVAKWKKHKIYYRIWWGYCPGENENDWEVYGDWERDG